MLKRYVAPEARRVVTLAAFMVPGVAAQLVGPSITRAFVDKAVSGGRHAPLSALWILAGLFIAAAIATQLLQIGATYSSAQLAWGATNRMRRDLATHVLYLDMSYHTATSRTWPTSSRSSSYRSSAASCCWSASSSC